MSEPCDIARAAPIGEHVLISHEVVIADGPAAPPRLGGREAAGIDDGDGAGTDRAIAPAARTTGSGQ